MPNFMNDIMGEWGYRRKFRPEHLDEYDDDDKAWHYNHTEFYEIEDVDDQTVIVHFFNGNKETGTRTTSRRDLNYCERLWGDRLYYRTPNERLTAEWANRGDV